MKNVGYCNTSSQLISVGNVSHRLLFLLSYFKKLPKETFRLGELNHFFDGFS